MTALSDLIKELRELDAAAFPAPWDNRCYETMNNMAKPRHIWTEYGWLAEVENTLDSGIQNANLIARYRNTMSLLLDVIEAQGEALAFYADLIHNHQFIFDDETSSRAEVYERYEKYSIGDLGVKATETITKIEALIKESEGE